MAKINKKGFVVVGLVAVITAMAATTVSINPILANANTTQNIPTKATIATNPTKTNYLTGEVFDPTGLTLNVSCSGGAGFVLEYNEETASKFVFDTTPLTSSVLNVTIGYQSPNGGSPVNVTIPVFVDNYRIDQADIYINDDDRVIFSIGGAYGEGYEEQIRDATFYLVPYGDKYRYDETNPVVTPASSGATYGDFVAEIDVTDIYSVATGKDTETASRYWPHFVMGGVDRDLKFPNLKKKTVVRESDPSTTYILNLFTSATEQKYIPVIAASGTAETFTYHWDINDATYTIPETVTKGYMPYYCDIALENNKVIWTVTAKYKGYTHIREIERALAYNLHGYVTPGKKTDTPSIANKSANAVSTVNKLYSLEMNAEEQTFSFSLDITNYKTNALYGGNYFSYFLRFGGNDANGANDTKTATSENHNKTITFEGRNYIVLNDSTKSVMANAWGCLGFKIVPAE